MNVSLDAQIPSSLYGETSGPSSPRRLSTRDPRQYRQVVFDQVGEIHLAHQYDNSQLHVQIFEAFKVLSSTGIGRTILADLKALSALGMRIAIGPRDDADARNMRVSPYGVAHTVDGAVLWDCVYPDHGLDTPSPTPEAYGRLIREFAQLRNLAAEKAWQGSPVLRPDDAEAAFMAELAVATAPAFAASGFCPPFPIWSAAPDWPRGPTYFDALEMLMPAWLTEGGRTVRDEVVAVLRLVQETPWGRRLLNDIWVYGRSRAVTLIHHSATGRQGVHKVNNGTPIWCYDRAALERDARPGNLTEREARASGAFIALLRVRRALSEKLAMLGNSYDALAAQTEFEGQLIEARQRRTVPPVAPPRTGSPAAGLAPARRLSVPSVQAPSARPGVAAESASAHVYVNQPSTSREDGSFFE